MEGTPVISPAPTKSFAIGNFKWKNSYLLYIGGAALATYGIVLAVKQANLLKKTCFKPAGFVPNQLGLTNADINIKLNMKNKSNVEYFLTNQVYNVYISDQFVGAIKNPNKIAIAPATPTSPTVSPIWLNVKFNPMQVANISWDTLKGLITGGGNVKVQIKGNATVTDKSGIFRYNYPVDSVFTLKDLTSGTTSDPC
jgi:hypothetical protein